MKPAYFSIILTTLSVATSSYAADKAVAEKKDPTVAFRTTMGSPRYVTTGGKGALNTSGKEITSGSIFVLLDLNGGELADGDPLQIKWVPSQAKPTYWHEEAGKVNRVGGKPDGSCTFTVKFPATTVKQTPRVLTLQTASAKWVAAPTDKVALSTTDRAENALSLELIENPTPKAAAKDGE